MQINFRSWRDTGITWLALQGVDIAKMQRRAGHDSISTTLGYVKMAEDLTGSIGEPFPPLPKALVSGQDGPGGGGPSQPKGGPRGSQRVWANDWAKSKVENSTSSTSLANSVGEAGTAGPLLRAAFHERFAETLGELAEPRNTAQRGGPSGDGAAGNWEAMNWRPIAFGSARPEPRPGTGSTGSPRWPSWRSRNRSGGTVHLLSPVGEARPSRSSSRNRRDRMRGRVHPVRQPRARAPRLRHLGDL
jgi:hypothetical protein